MAYPPTITIQPHLGSPPSRKPPHKAYTRYFPSLSLWLFYDCMSFCILYVTGLSWTCFTHVQLYHALLKAKFMCILMCISLCII
jgi:hypothetical protein